MGFKRKMKRKGKVINLDDEMGLFYNGGVVSLAEEYGVTMDEMFITLIELTTSGVVRPIVVPLENDRQALHWQLARDMREVERFKREFRDGRLKGWEDIETAKEVRDSVFGALPGQENEDD